MPRLSCIIPVVGNVRQLETTLVSVLANRPDDCEVLVVHSTPYDDPYDVKSEVRFLEAAAQTGYISCANLGIQASTGPVVHLLAAGLEVAEGWADAALARLVDPTVAAVAPVVWREANCEPMASAGVTYLRGGRRQVCEQPPGSSKEVAPLGPAASAAFYRKSALLGLGGLPELLGDELADIDFALTLAAAGWRAVLEPRSEVLQTSTERPPSPRHGYRYGIAAERLFWRNLPTTGQGATLLAHWGTLCGELLRAGSVPAALGQLFGRLAALGSLGDSAAQRRRLEELRRRASDKVTPEPSPALLPRRIDSPHSPLRESAPSGVRVARS